MRDDLIMANITLSAFHSDDGFYATIDFSSGVSISSSEIYSTKSEALKAAVSKLLSV